MTVPGYDTCDCDKYNPDCRCHPRQEADPMTEHDTTDHVAAIKDLTDKVSMSASSAAMSAGWSEERWDEAAGDYLVAIDKHADALATRLAAAEAERDAERARAGRLRVAVRKAADRELSRVVTDEVNRRDGDMPSREWVSLRKGTIESNIYANDGLEFGDLDGSDTDA